LTGEEACYESPADRRGNSQVDSCDLALIQWSAPRPQQRPDRDPEDEQLADYRNGGNLGQRITCTQSSVDVQAPRLDDGINEEETERQHERGNRYAKRGCRAELAGRASPFSLPDEVNDLRQRDVGLIDPVIVA